MHLTPNRPGWMEAIVGCMYSGKTSELIRRLLICKYAKQKVMAFKPGSDDRYDAANLVTHEGAKFSVATGFERNPESLYSITEDRGLQVVGIEEAQFWDAGIVEVCEGLANRGVRVIVAGLDLDYRGEPFGVMPRLVMLSEYVTKLQAACMVCGEPATRTQKIAGGDDVVDPGAADKYEARCRHHWTGMVNV